MKLFRKLRIYWGKSNVWTDFETLIAERQLSALDKQRIVDYLSGKYSFVRKRRAKKERISPGGHTEEKLNRMVDMMGKEFTPPLEWHAAS